MWLLEWPEENKKKEGTLLAQELVWQKEAASFLHLVPISCQGICLTSFALVPPFQTLILFYRKILFLIMCIVSIVWLCVCMCRCTCSSEELDPLEWEL